MVFEWNLSKELQNIKKHGVSFSEAIKSFNDPLGFVLEDLKHSDAEPRFYWIGKSSSGCVLTTRFTSRENRIRIFGSAEWREYRIMYYEKTKSQ